jgi:RHS repeat-associated protein
VLVDANSDGSTVSYVNGPGIDNKLKLTHSVNGAKYFVSDHLGSARALTDGSGAVVESVNYDSFGNATGALSTRYGYTGRELDSETGLMYYRNRWFDPQAGRFVSEDPIEFEGGINWYAYVDNNPHMMTDPFGEDGVPGRRMPRRPRRGRWPGPVFGGGVVPPGPVPDIDPSGSDEPAPLPKWRPKTQAPPPWLPPIMSDSECECIDVPRNYDFVTISLRFPIGNFGIGPDITLDRELNVYLGPQVSLGSPAGKAASLSYGWLPSLCTPKTKELNNFLTGFSGSLTGYYGPGGGFAYSYGNGFAPLVGIGTPGVSGSAGYSWHIF